MTEEAELAEGIHAALYGVGRLQPLLDDPEVENIDINGYDSVFVGYANGEEKRFPPVAESDEELVELVQVLGAYSSITSRPFDTANPQLDLRLPDGSRLSAVMGVCQRPSLSIRRARIQRASLDMLVENGSMSPELAGFLSAAVAARKNIMIAGATNAGKTTLLRALANEIPPSERLITVERALELGLGEFEDLHPNVVAFEERLPNSEGQGAIQMGELVRRSLRMNPSRVIVGEVLGDEIVTMLNAMSQGNDGSLSTIHANSSLEVFNRICTYAIQSAERLPVRRHDDADRRCDRLRHLRRASQRVRLRWRAAPAGHLGARGQRCRRTGALQRDLRRGPRRQRRTRCSDPVPGRAARRRLPARPRTGACDDLPPAAHRPPGRRHRRRPRAARLLAAHGRRRRGHAGRAVVAAARRSSASAPGCRSRSAPAC